MAEGSDSDGPRLYVPVERRGAYPPCSPKFATILVVEDDATVRELVRSILGRRGYEVITWDSPRSALAWAANARPGEHELLLTELSLPGMSGEQLAEQLHKDRPGLRVVLISTRGEDAPLPAEARGYLARPFTTDELVGSVERALCADQTAPQPA